MKSLSLIAVFVLSVLIPKTSSSGFIAILEPNEGAHLVAETSHLDVGIKFNISNSDVLKNVVFCTRLLYQGTQELVPSTCFPITTSDLILQKLLPGNYSVECYLQRSSGPDFEIVSASTVTRNFKVIPLSDVQLALAVSNDRLLYVAPPHGNSADIDISYALSLSPMITSYLDLSICITLASITERYVDNECIAVTPPPDQSSIVVRAIPIGKYSLSLYLLHTKSNFVFQSTALSRQLTVDLLADSLPHINVNAMPMTTTTIDGVVDTKTDVATVVLSFDVIGNKKAIQLVEVCISIVNTISSEEMLLMPLQMLSTGMRTITLQGIPAGRHTATLSLCTHTASVDNVTTSNNNSNNNNNNKQQDIFVYMQSVVEISLDVRYPIEFVPTYEWQTLHIYHTIPASAETR